MKVVLGWRDFRFVIDHKLHESCVASILPFSIFELGNKYHTFDIIRKQHSLLGEGVQTFNNHTIDLGISELGDYEVMLPLFYLARFYSSLLYPDHLEKLLTIWLTAI